MWGAGEPAQGQESGSASSAFCLLGDVALLAPSSPAIYAGRRAGPRVMCVEELAMSHTSCSTQESRRCTLPGQQGRAGPGSGGCW